MYPTETLRLEDQLRGILHLERRSGEVEERERVESAAHMAALF
jgi:hypothetical protein